MLHVKRFTEKENRLFKMQFKKKYFFYFIFFRSFPISHAVSAWQVSAGNFCCTFLFLWKIGRQDKEKRLSISCVESPICTHTHTHTHTHIEGEREKKKRDETFVKFAVCPLGSKVPHQWILLTYNPPFKIHTWSENEASKL